MHGILVATNMWTVIVNVAYDNISMLLLLRSFLGGENCTFTWEDITDLFSSPGSLSRFSLGDITFRIILSYFHILALGLLRLVNSVTHVSYAFVVGLRDYFESTLRKPYCVTNHQDNYFVLTKSMRKFGICNMIWPYFSLKVRTLRKTTYVLPKRSSRSLNPWPNLPCTIYWRTMWVSDL